MPSEEANLISNAAEPYFQPLDHYQAYTLAELNSSLRFIDFSFEGLWYMYMVSHLY